MDELQIEILESIGGWGFSFRDLYAKAKDFKGSKIRVPVNTYGGDAFQALLIYNFLKGHKAQVEIHIPAYACSAGTMIAAAGDYVTIAENGFYMIHDPKAGVFGESEDMERTAKLLDDLTDAMVNMYREKTGLDKERIRTMMEKETWLTAGEALEMGFVNALTKGARIQASADVASFKNVPKALIQPPAVKVSPQKVKMEDQNLQFVAGFLGLDAGATMADVQSAIFNLRNQVSTLTAKNSTLEAENATFKASQKALQTAQATELLDAALSEGRITNEQRPFLETMFKADHDGAVKYLATIQGKVKKLSQVPAAGGAVTAMSTYQGKSFKELEKENPAALTALKEQDFETFKALFKASYGTDWKD